MRVGEVKTTRHAPAHLTKQGAGIGREVSGPRIAQLAGGRATDSTIRSACSNS
jgi:hypothetical protein